MLALETVRERWVWESRFHSLVIFTRLSAKIEPSRKTALLETLLLSGDNLRPVRQTISSDQFMSAKIVSAGSPKPSTARTVKSSSSKAVVPLNCGPVIMVGGFFLLGILGEVVREAV